MAHHARAANDDGLRPAAARMSIAFGADFGMTRLACDQRLRAVSPSARYTPIIAGADPRPARRVTTSDNSQHSSLSAPTRPTQPGTPARTGYLLGIGVCLRVTVPVTATVAGSAGNVLGRHNQPYYERPSGHRHGHQCARPDRRPRCRDRCIFSLEVPEFHQQPHARHHAGREPMRPPVSSRA